MNVSQSNIVTAREMFSRATTHLENAIAKYQDIIETQEVTIYKRRGMNQRELIDNLPQAYADYFTWTNAADALMRLGVRQAGDSIPESMRLSMIEHLDTMRTEMVAMDTYRKTRQLGTNSISINGVATAKGDAETITILLDAMQST